MHYAGIDLSKQRLDVAVLNETGDVTDQTSVPNTPTGYDQLTDLVDRGTPVGMEAGTLAYPVHDYLVGEGYTVRLGDSKRMKTIWDCDQKFDEKDAREIADLVRIDKFPDVYVPDPDVLEARELVRARKDVVEQCTQAKQRLGAFLRREGVQPPFDGKTLYSETGRAWLRDQDIDANAAALMEAFVAQIEALEPRVEALDAMVADLIVEDEVVDRLVSIPGIGLHNAAVIRYEVGTMARFETIGRFRAYAGAVPRTRQSGDRSRQEGPVRRCNKHLKAAVGIAAESAATKTKGDNPVKAIYQRQRGRGKSRSTALGHARGKLCNTVYAVWTKDEECSWENPESTMRKRRTIKRLAGQDPGP